MRILITGAGGQLGRALRAALSDRDVVALNRSELDVTDPTAVAEAIARAEPACVIHCAALTDTALCERDPARAASVNAEGTWNVAVTCQLVGTRLFAVSTNEVFDGAAAEPYAERAERHAVNVYGSSKAEAERLAIRECADTLVVRTSWLYGDGPRNFPARVLDNARSGVDLRFVTDETAAPTSTADLASAIRALIDREAPAGIYHLVNEGEASRYDFACEIIRLGGFDPASVTPITTADLRAGGYDGPVKPPYSVLANNVARVLGITMPPWRDALAAHFARLGASARG